MAIIKVVFKVDGEETEVIRLSYQFDQDIDPIGQPAGEVRGGQINVTVPASKASEARFGWMVDPNMKKEGEIDFVDSTGQILKTLVFTDAYCIGYIEEFEAFSSGASGTVNVRDGAKETLTLSCRIIEVGGESHENTWPDA
jgi:hypothetical protein